MKFFFFILLFTCFVQASEPSASHRHRKKKAAVPSVAHAARAEHDPEILQALCTELQAHLATIELLAQELACQKEINKQQQKTNEDQTAENRRLQGRIDTLFDMFAQLSLRQSDSRSGTHNQSNAGSASSTPLTRSPFTATASGYGFVDDD